MLTYDNEKKKVVHKNETQPALHRSAISFRSRFNKPYFRLIAASIILALNTLL